ncbi:hypothetical protein DFR47_11353 [Pseudochrobactrum asaccharolyticum]|uniref:Uncharacterized protein n=1 Tax=Pseudochrobactrum asaccharolyticum TaxID=354351 RepID=A0A366DK88_9HYPH|nr:hypothetical protein DFR47_11353 [Pseudochrobactrum asaccharolyticum]
MTAKRKTIVDIWGGHHSMDHVARFVVPIDEALSLAQHELEQGFLVNLRCDERVGSSENFDLRAPHNPTIRGNVCPNIKSS